MQKTKLLNYQNMKSHYPMAFNQQTPADKKQIIDDAKKTIEEMRNRLKTEKNPAIRARCEEIIANQQEKIERELVSLEILQKKHFYDLCDMKSKRK